MLLLQMHHNIDSSTALHATQEHGKSRKRKREESFDIDSIKQERPSAGLLDLSPLCLLRISSHLCPDDLTSLAQVCRSLRVAASEQELWRLLFLQRWEVGEMKEMEQADMSWKEIYRKRDEADIRRFEQDEILREAYIGAALAKRTEPLNMLAASYLLDTAAASPGDISTRVAAFKRDRGIPPTTIESSFSKFDKFKIENLVNLDGGSSDKLVANDTSKVGCTQECKFVELDPNIWICESCGFVHFCGESCGERRIDAEDQVICRLTGRVFGHLFKHDGPIYGNAADTDDDWNEGVGEGRLGRAYLAGYSADRNEMRARFGVDFGI